MGNMLHSKYHSLGLTRAFTNLDEAAGTMRMCIGTEVKFQSSQTALLSTSQAHKHLCLVESVVKV